jgi:hypothetical protein
MSLIKLSAVPVALTFAGSSALAGPYVNIENNAGFTGSDYNGSLTEFAVGFSGDAGPVSYYIQGGPALVSPDGGETETELSGKGGGNISLNEKLDVYGELSFITGDVNSYGTKAGVTYNF